MRSRSEVRNPANVPTAIKGNTEGSVAFKSRCASSGVKRKGRSLALLTTDKVFDLFEGMRVEQTFLYGDTVRITDISENLNPGFGALFSALQATF